MKNTILSLTLSIITTIGLHAVDIQWQIDLPEGTVVEYAAAGNDGSAIVDTTDDKLLWIGANGNVTETISNFQGTVGGSASITNTQLILLVYLSSSGFTQVITKTESGHAIETINGQPEFEAPLQSSYPFFLIREGLQLTLYRQDTNSSSSLGVTMVPANAIVIPASHQGDVTISLESSTDLVEWNNVEPGSYSSSDGARFFRVKAVTEN